MRTTRLLGLVLATATVVALTADTASAQRGGRRGGFGVSVGNGYGGYGSGYGNGWGYGGSGWGYGNGYSGFNSPYYSSGVYNNFSGSGYYTSPQYSYSNGYSSPMSYGSTGYASSGYGNTGYASAGGCGSCDPCSGGGAYMSQGGSSTQGGYSNGGFVQAGYSPNSQMGLRIVAVEDGPAQTAGIQQGSVVVAVDGHNVSSFQDLQTAIRNGGSGSGNNGNNNNLKMTLIDPSGQRVTRNVAVKDNRIGVSVVEVPVSIPNVNNQDGANDNNSGTNNRNQNLNNSTVPGRLPGNSTNPSTTPGSTTPDRGNPNRTNPSSSSTTPGSSSGSTTSPTRPRADD